eukprot:2249657-Pleurochrysis_carterae.AAC.2
MAGALDVSAPRDARPLEVRDDSYSGPLARVRGTSDPRAMVASRSSPVGGGEKGHSESVPTVHGSFDLSMAGAPERSSFDDTQQLEALVPETKDVGRRDSEEEAEVAGSEIAPDRDETKEVGADLPVPGMYVRVALEVEQDGIAVLILSPSASEGQAEKESVEPTPHSPAGPCASTTPPDRTEDEHCPALYDGPVWIEEMELLREAHPPETSLDVTIAVCNIPGNPSWQSKSTSQWHRASVGRGRGGTVIRRSMAEKLDDLSYQPDAVRRLRSRDQAEGEGYPCQVYVRIEWDCMGGRAILHTAAYVLPRLDVPICIGESDYVQACREAGERKETEALESMVNAPPSLPPSAPPMHMDEVHGEPRGAGPSLPPEGHELEARDEIQERSDSGETNATDNNLTALARNVRDDAVAPIRPISPVTELRFDQGWRVRPCQSPEIGAPIPTTARAATTPVVALEPSFNQDLIFSTFASRLLPGGEDIEDYAANTGHYYMPPPSPIYHSHRIIWVEIWKDDHR